MACWIVICGASSVGKTTLAEDWLKKHRTEYQYLEEVARGVMEKHSIMREDVDASLKTEEKRVLIRLETLIFEEQNREELAFQSRGYKAVVVDRGPDPLAFLCQLKDQQAADDLSQTPAASACLDRYRNSCLVVVVGLLDNIVDDGFRRVQGRQEQEEYTQILFSQLDKHKIPYHHLKETDREKRIYELEKIVEDTCMYYSHTGTGDVISHPNAKYRSDQMLITSSATNSNRSAPSLSAFYTPIQMSKSNPALSMQRSRSKSTPSMKPSKPTFPMKLSISRPRCRLPESPMRRISKYKRISSVEELEKLFMSHSKLDERGGLKAEEHQVALTSRLLNARRFRSIGGSSDSSSYAHDPKYQQTTRKLHPVSSSPASTREFVVDYLRMSDTNMDSRISTPQDYENVMSTYNSPSVSMYLHCANNIALVPFLDLVEVLTCDSFGCEYYNSGHDITLRIPDGTIPSGMTAHIEVAVTLYGPFQFSDGSCPISPILWVCVQENIKFGKPIEVILPHFLADLSEDDIERLHINFAKAPHNCYSIDEFGLNHYSFTQLNSNFIAHNEGNKGYGILSTDHCCFYCITSNNPITPSFALKAGYCLWCIEKPSHSVLQSPGLTAQVGSRDVLLFCATFCLPSCRTALKSQYTVDDGYFIRKPKLFNFKDPGDGSEPRLMITFAEEDHTKCTIAADPSNKQIKASQIYFWDDKKDKLKMLHEEKIYPPTVSLTLEVTESHPIHVHFHGSIADEELNMDVMLPLAIASDARAPVRPRSFERKWNITDKPKLYDLLEELYSKIAHKWEDIGIFLKMEPSVLDMLKTDNSTSHDRLREMLKLWLKSISPPPSWCAIATALQKVGNEDLASHIRSKYNC